MGRAMVKLYDSSARPLVVYRGRVAQLVRAPASHAGGHRFESCRAHHPTRVESTTCYFHFEAFSVLKFKNVSEPYQNPSDPDTPYQNPHALIFSLAWRFSFVKASLFICNFI